MRTVTGITMLWALTALSGCGGTDGGSDGPKAITTEAGDTKYGLLAEKTTCADWLDMTDAKKLQTLKYVDSLRDLEKPDRTLEDLADKITRDCNLDPVELADATLLSLLVIDMIN